MNLWFFRISMVWLALVLADEFVTQSKNYEKDEYSYSHKNVVGADKQTPEDDKAMLDFFEAWAMHASKMASPIVTLEIPAGGLLTFYVNVVKVPQVIRGLYSVSEDAAKSITLTILDPFGGLSFIKSDARDLLFYPAANLPGIYTVQMKNTNVKLYVIVVF